MSIVLESITTIEKAPTAKKTYQIDWSAFLRVQDKEKVLITAASNVSPVVVTIKQGYPTNLSDATPVFIAGCLGNTSPNGFRYLKFVTSTTYQLYTDAALTTAVVGNGAFIAGSAYLWVVDPIVTATWTFPAGLTKVSDSKTGVTTTVTVSGGTSGQVYAVTLLIVTVSGMEDPRIINFTIAPV